MFKPALKLFAGILAHQRKNAVCRRKPRNCPVGVQHLEDRVLLSAVIGDFNGDGSGDLAVGVPLENLGSVVDAGSVNVIYGIDTGLSSLNDQDWSQDSAGVKDSAESGDRFGTALAIGDFNGDGFDDLAIGIPGEDIGDVEDAGAVAVLYGSANRLGSGGTNGIPENQLFHQDTPGLYDIPERFDRFGSALTTGDFDGDGFDDLAIGIPGENFDGVLDAGGVQVIYGSSGGLDQYERILLRQSDSIGRLENYDFFGSALAAGDFDNDGRDDLVVGVPGEDLNISNRNAIDAGAVNVFFGSNGRLSTSNAWFLFQDTNLAFGNIADTSEDFDYFGSSLAVGDVNDDGLDDLAIGVPGEDTPGKQVDAGAVNVIVSIGGSRLANGNQIWTQDSSGIDETALANDLFGTSLAIADFDGDGDNDLAIGVPGKDVKESNLQADAGGIHIIESAGANGLTSTGNRFLSQATSDIEGTAKAGDAFGSSLAAGHIDAGQRADLVVAIPGEEVSNIVKAGGVAVLYGTSSISTFNTSTDQFFSQNSSGVNGAAESGDQLGGLLPAGLRHSGLQVPALASNPGATYTLYLDFTGHDDHILGYPIKTDVFDMDVDRDFFSITELALIQDIWDTIAEDYAPFDINVTTVSSGNAATEQRLVFGGRWQDNPLTKSVFGELPASGVSLPTFTNSALSNTSFVFTKSIFGWDIQQTGIVIGNVGSHEAGHAFGLQHKSDTTSSVVVQNEYSSGGPGWTPIMGDSFASGRAIWTRATMTNPTEPKLTIRGDDDVAILTDVLGLRSDDHSNTLTNATNLGQLQAFGDLVVGHGVIESRFDADTFVFNVGISGSVDIDVLVNDVAANLDTIVNFGNAQTGETIVSTSSSTMLGASLVKTVSPGQYFIQVKSANIFRGDIGQFTVRVEMHDFIFEGGPSVGVVASNRPILYTGPSLTAGNTTIGFGSKSVSPETAGKTTGTTQTKGTIVAARGSIPTSASSMPLRKSKDEASPSRQKRTEPIRTAANRTERNLDLVFGDHASEAFADLLSGRRF